MGTRARNMDRLRTVWTPEMDRYFIDLMLDQIGKGNRIDDHLFSKRAWKQMTALFNMKFEFQYDKDVLKNRHKSLRNLYRAVKNLLDQPGFSWDEARQMMTADNSVWDEYIKVHPDARSFRIKSIPYYCDLCMIYRNEKGENVPPTSPHLAEDGIAVACQLGNICDGSVGSSHEITVNEDYEMSITKEFMDGMPLDAQSNTGSAVNNSRSRTYWQPPMDRYFIDLMLDQIRNGNQIDGVFRKHAWVVMIASFNSKFGFNYDIDVLKNRYKTLRRQYNVIKNLLDLDGFFWDDTRQMVTADDHVWQDYIKTHTDARQFMTRPIPYYKDLCAICGDCSVEERDCLSGLNLGQIHEGKFQETLQSSQSTAASDSNENQLADVQEVIRAVVSDQKKRCQLESLLCSPHLKRAKGKHEGIATALEEMVTAVGSLSEKKEDSKSNSVLMEKVVEAVQALPEIDEELVLDACDLLEDEKKARTFLALDIKLRKKWLMRKLRPQMQAG